MQYFYLFISNIFTVIKLNWYLKTNIEKTEAIKYNSLIYNNFIYLNNAKYLYNTLKNITCMAENESGIIGCIDWK